MRDPSIHITKLQFEEILEYLEIDHFPTEAFFTIARKKAVNSRVVPIVNNKVNKKLTNITLASKGDASLIADLIYAIRIKKKHKGVRKITEANGREWTNCKKLANICCNFCQDFQLETREGFIKYLEIGISRMNDCKNLLQRLISMNDNIFAQYESQLVWEDSTKTDKEVCIDIQKYYVKKIADATGIYNTFEKDIEKMVHFMKLYRLCQQHNWPPYQFLDAQFESLAWCNGLPDIAQLYTDKSIERYNKYLYKHINHSSPLDTPETEGSLWDQINEV